MFDARKRPGRRDDQSVGVLFYNELPIHLRKDNQVSIGLLGTRRKVANLEKICVRITERTGNLSNRNLHVDSGNTDGTTVTLQSLCGNQKIRVMIRTTSGGTIRSQLLSPD